MPTCLLLLLTLCSAVHDRPVAALTVVQTSALIGDGITTAKWHAGLTEGDPLSRIFIGTHPTMLRMIPAGIGEMVITTYVAEKMHSSSHAWERKIWWVPQTLAISGHSAGIAVNIPVDGILKNKGRK